MHTSQLPWPCTLAQRLNSLHTPGWPRVGSLLEAGGPSLSGPSLPQGWVGSLCHHSATVSLSGGRGLCFLLRGNAPMYRDWRPGGSERSEKKQSASCSPTEPPSWPSRRRGLSSALAPPPLTAVLSCDDPGLLGSRPSTAPGMSHTGLHPPGWGLTTGVMAWQLPVGPFHLAPSHSCVIPRAKPQTDCLDYKENI